MSANDQGMVKLIFSSSFDSSVDVGMRIVEDPKQIVKSASTIFGCDYNDVKPDADHVGIHVVALGDFEHYGLNRNGDGFPKRACVDYHDTFTKHGNVYRHHRNKNPEKRLGQVVKSAYNEPMGRIELFIHAHKEKAHDELEKLAKDGEIPLSMACKVAFDRCTVCNTKRKSSMDPNQCEHVRDSLGKMAEDGKIVGTQNDEPQFFDISFVSRPADRIAWNLKTASGDVLDSIKLAEYEGVCVPDRLAITSASALEKLAVANKLARLETLYHKLSKQACASTSERYMWELRKAASCKLDDATIESLRCFEPKDVFHKLAQRGIVMDVESFYKYALGPQYHIAEMHMDGIKAALPTVFSRVTKEGACQGLCNCELFDVDADRYTTLLGQDDRKLDSVVLKVACDVTFVGAEVDRRIIEATLHKINLDMTLDKKAGIEFNNNVIINTLVEKYAAYKLSALRDTAALNKAVDTDALFAVAVAQDFIN